MSSKLDRETGICTITAPCYSTMPVGYRLYLGHTHAAASAACRRFDDYLARLALAQSSNGKPWGEGVDVKPPEDALLEALTNGSLHPSLVAEPQALP